MKIFVITKDDYDEYCEILGVYSEDKLNEEIAKAFSEKSKNEHKIRIEHLEKELIKQKAFDEENIEKIKLSVKKKKESVVALEERIRTISDGPERTAFIKEVKSLNKKIGKKTDVVGSIRRYTQNKENELSKIKAMTPKEILDWYMDTKNIYINEFNLNDSMQSYTGD